MEAALVGGSVKPAFSVTTSVTFSRFLTSAAKCWFDAVPAA